MDTNSILKANKERSLKSKLFSTLSIVDNHLGYDPKADITFGLLLDLKREIENYKNYFIFSINDRCLTTVPTHAKKLNKVLNLVKKSINGLPKKQREHYFPLTLIDNVRELMLEDVKYLSNKYSFEMGDDSVLKRFKKA